MACPRPPSRRGDVICTLMEAWKKGLHRLLWQGCVAASFLGFYFNRCIGTLGTVQLDWILKYQRREITSLPASRRDTVLREGGGTACEGMWRQVWHGLSWLEYCNNRSVCHPPAVNFSCCKVAFVLKKPSSQVNIQHCMQFPHSLSLVLTVICNISIHIPPFTVKCWHYVMYGDRMRGAMADENFLEVIFKLISAAVVRNC